MNTPRETSTSCRPGKRKLVERLYSSSLIPEYDAPDLTPRAAGRSDSMPSACLTISRRSAPKLFVVMRRSHNSDKMTQYPWSSQGAAEDAGSLQGEANVSLASEQWSLID